MTDVFATLDENGVPTGFYKTEIHGKNIPIEAIKISENDWQECVEHAGKRRFVNGKITDYEPSPEPKTWDEIREKRNAYLRLSDYVEFSTRLTEEQRAVALAWRSSLFTITDDFASPDDVVWPVVPDFITI